MIESQLEPRELGHLSLVVPPNLIAPLTTETSPAPGLTAGVLSARSIQDDLKQLGQACNRYLEEVESVREYYVDVANSVAKMIGDVGLHDTVLPRNYQVRCHQYQLYLLKLSPGGVPLFVATGQDDLFTRMGAGSRCELRSCDLAEFANDLNQGLIADLTEYVSARLPSTRLSGVSDRATRLPSSEELTHQGAAVSEAREAQLRNLGRRASRVASSG